MAFKRPRYEPPPAPAPAPAPPPAPAMPAPPPEAPQAPTMAAASPRGLRMSHRDAVKRLVSASGRIYLPGADGVFEIQPEDVPAAVRLGFIEQV